MKKAFNKKNLVIPLLVLLPLVILRGFAIYVTGVDLGMFLWRGLFSDIMVASLAFVVLRFLVNWDSRLLERAEAEEKKANKLPWILVSLLLTLWVLFNYGNFEHILANDSNFDPTNLKFLKSKTFMSGSALHISHPVVACLCLVLPLILYYGVRGPERVDESYKFPILVGVLIGLLWPANGSELLWLQEHPLHSLFRSNTDQKSEVVESRRNSEFDQQMAADLSGKPRFPFYDKTKHNGRLPNILVIMLEGVSGGHIPSLAALHRVKIKEAMPKMSTLAKKNFGAASFISHQRQTDRGEYSLLCGDVPKLTRKPPRMTDIATSSKAPRECLPAFLNRQGYETVYLQPAPMSFMMKDRFMDKIGFKTSKGADFFDSGYERGGWGIDDRAFFEKSFKVFKDLEKKGKPWMAALMTVGTHHPLIVPSSFKKKAKESKFNWALRYTDTYLAALIEKMRKAGMLKHTVVVVTSDESRGFKEIGGVTRTLSQNWSFVVSMLPTSKPTLVKEPYAQSDLALSLIDYIGLGKERHEFIGRSLFRTYEEPRSMAFSNIFFRSAYYLGKDFRLTKCKEDLSKCTHYTRKNESFFGPGWTKTSSQPQDRYELGRYLSWSIRNYQEISSFRPKMSMATLNRGLVELKQEVKKGQWVFGGQFLSAPEGKKAEIEVDFELLGHPNSLVSVSSRMVLDHKPKFIMPKIPFMKGGERFKLSYTYSQEGPLKQLEHLLYVRRFVDVPGRLLIHKAEIRFVDLEKNEKEEQGGQLQEYGLFKLFKNKWVEIEKKNSYQKRYSIYDDDHFVLPSCISKNEKGELIGKKCRYGHVVLGPYADVPPQSKVKARFVLEGTQGEGKVMMDLCTGAGRKIHKKSEFQEIKPGETITLEIESTFTDFKRSLETRLKAKNTKGKSFDFKVVQGEIEILPLTAEEIELNQSKDKAVKLPKSIDLSPKRKGQKKKPAFKKKSILKKKSAPKKKLAPKKK